ncbi:MAG: response regulator [Blautia sp.]|nr:response regulator [Blautia sp.]
MNKHTILVVDDNRTNLQIVRDVLEKNYTLLLANSGERALKFIQKRKPDLILLDLMMPGMDGKETFREIRKEPENTGIPVIFLTANQDEEAEVECLALGASDFITKPIVPQILERRISNTIALEELQKHLQQKIDEKTQEIKTLALQSIYAIVHTLEAKDDVTRGHSVRVAGFSRALAVEMGLDDTKVEQVYQTALLHDVGKIGIPDAILKKKGQLTEEEFTIIKQHTTIGADILSTISTMDFLQQGARYHHERYDGRGYPMGLSGEQIPLIGRIIAVADVYDALISERQYKNAMEKYSARDQLLKNSGSQFDPEVLRCFIRLLDSGVLDEIEKL